MSRNDAAIMNNYSESPAELGATQATTRSPRPRVQQRHSASTEQTAPEPTSTAVTAPVFPRSDSRIRELLHTLLMRADDEIFEDGMESNFSVGLKNFIWIYRESGLSAVAGFIEDDSITPSTLAELLRVLGRIDDAHSRNQRRWILARCLRHPSPVVRDGAAVGLSYLDERRAALYIRTARVRESYEPLKDIYDQILMYLPSS